MEDIISRNPEGINDFLKDDDINYIESKTGDSIHDLSDETIQEILDNRFINDM